MTMRLGTEISSKIAAVSDFDNESIVKRACMRFGSLRFAAIAAFTSA